MKIREKIALLKPKFAAQLKKELDPLTKETNAEIHLWYAHLDGVQGRHNASHSKPVLFWGEKMDKLMHSEAGRRGSVLETTMMMFENGFGSPLRDVDDSAQSQKLVDPLSTEVAGTSHESVTSLVRCASTVKILEKSVDILSEPFIELMKSASQTSSVLK